jgi:hypothetical protein
MIRMAAAANEVINPWDLESAKPTRSLRYATTDQLIALGFLFNATMGRWVISPPTQ